MTVTKSERWFNTCMSYSSKCDHNFHFDQSPDLPGCAAPASLRFSPMLFQQQICRGDTLTGDARLEFLRNSERLKMRERIERAG